MLEYARIRAFATCSEILTRLAASRWPAICDAVICSLAAKGMLRVSQTTLAGFHLRASLNVDSAHMLSIGLAMGAFTKVHRASQHDFRAGGKEGDFDNDARMRAHNSHEYEEALVPHEAQKSAGLTAPSQAKQSGAVEGDANVEA